MADAALHPVHFVGAGPGDPELITVKGQRLLAEADRVVYAGSLVPKALLSWCKPGCEYVDSAPLALPETHALLAGGYRAGLRVVRLHTGDPGLYGAIGEQMALLAAEGIPCAVVPGVTAAFAAAAALRCELTLPEVTQTVILTRAAGRTPVPEREALAALGAHRATLLIYLSIHEISRVVADLTPHYGPGCPVAVMYRVGWPDERAIRGTLADIAAKVGEAGIRRQALIMVGEAFSEAPPETRSRLYDASFAHGFRNAAD